MMIKKQSHLLRRQARSHERPQTSVSGFTLVELLVALTIASVLTAIALPTLKDSMRQNTLSRAATLVKGAFVNARAQAVRTGRPFGVVIERRRHSIGSGTADNLNFTQANYSTRLYYVQSPIEYRGDFQGAVVYPVYEDTNSGNDTDAIVPRLFIPLSSAGLLYAAADTTQAANSTAAAILVSQGTRFSVGNSDYVFEITGMEQVSLSASNPTTSFSGRTIFHPQVEPSLTTNPPPVDGTLISFNFLDFSPEHGQISGQYYNTQGRSLAVAAELSRFPTGIPAFQGTDFQFQTNPIRAPLAPVTLIGKSIVDLSVSGTSLDPVAFSAHAIVDPAPATQIPPVQNNVRMNDVIVMFSPDGRLDGIYHDQRVITGGGSPTVSGFQYLRVNPAATVWFNVGYVDGLTDHIDDMARYPDHLTGTDFQVNATEPPLASPPPPANFAPIKKPNFANTDCAWVSVQALSGNIALDSVASQPTLNRLSTYYGYSATAPPTARNLVRDRLRQGRRLATAGTVQ